jgi:hypothetical protein
MGQNAHFLPIKILIFKNLILKTKSKKKKKKKEIASVTTQVLKVERLGALVNISLIK